MVIDGANYFEGTFTNADGIYNFDELPSYVYVDYLTTEDATTLADIQPYFAGRTHVNLPVMADDPTCVDVEAIDGDNDSLKLQAQQVTSDQLFMTGYRVWLNEVEPDYALTYLYNGTNDVVAAEGYDITNDSEDVYKRQLRWQRSPTRP